MTKASRVWGPAMVCAVLAVAAVSACGGGSNAAASADPQDLQKKMEIVQQQFQAEQQVLDKNQDSILNIVSGGGAQAPADFFDFLHDPGILLAEIGDAVEATPSDDLLVGWQAHADAWCALEPSDFDDDFFRCMAERMSCPRSSRSSIRTAGTTRPRPSSQLQTRTGSARAWHRPASRLRASIWTSSSLASAARKGRWTS